MARASLAIGFSMEDVMGIPVVSEIIITLKEWRRKRELKIALRRDLYEMYVRNTFDGHEPEWDLGSVYASIEEQYLRSGLTRAEIKKVEKSIATFAISG